MFRHLLRRNDAKIVFLVMDGLGDIRAPGFPKTALEIARTPHLDALAAEGLCGRSLPISIGVTPGSGPAHFALFGYDPLAPENDVGRGVLEVLGTGFELQPDDVAIRGNFATMDAKGVLTDRRAGRIPQEECVRICAHLQKLIPEIDGVKVLIMPVREYRFGIVLRGPGLSPEVEETDPQLVGMSPLPVTARSPEGRRTAEILSKLVERCIASLAKEPKANCVLLRGISRRPHVETLAERAMLRPAAIAAYPLYRGVAKLCGMELLDTGFSVKEEFETLRAAWSRGYDFFFIHIKKTDSAGEDGNLDAKVKGIEEVDAAMPTLLELAPDVLVVTGDHSTPCALKSHSWHPVPFLIRSKTCGADDARAFNESECDRGGLGVFPARTILELALANAGKLKKHGA